MNLFETFYKLDRLYESKQDIERFINKFGQETYDLFKKSTQRLKNKNISTDIVWHTKYSTKKDLEAILINLQNRAITKDGDLTTAAGEYKELGEADGFKVYEILDHIAAINLGVDTGWCISGRYNHYKEKNYNPTEVEAKKHWDDYAKAKARIYFFLSPNEKYAVVMYPETNIPLIDFNIELEDGKIANTTNFEVFTETDELDQSLIKILPYELLPQKLDFKWTQEVENNVQELADAIEKEMTSYYLVLLHGKGKTLVLFSGRDEYLATIIFNSRLDHLKSGHKLLKDGLVEVLELRQLSLEKDSEEDKEFRRQVNNKWAASSRGLILLPESLLGKTKENFLTDYTNFINGGGITYTNYEDEKFTNLKFLDKISDSTYKLALETTDEETIQNNEKEIEKFLNNLKQYL